MSDIPDRILHFQSLYQFQVNDVALKWSEVFGKVLQLRKNTAFEFEDVQVSDTTLEELFLAFGRMKQQMGDLPTSN